MLECIFTKCVESVIPSRLVRSAMSIDDNTLKIVNNHSFSLNKNCFIIGFGKATYEMAIEAENILYDHLQAGIISVPARTLFHAKRHLRPNSAIRVFEGAKNNLPDEDSFAAAKQIKHLAEQCSQDDILLVLISGGGSALFPYPISPITLNEKIATIKLLTAAGADITELNTVRRSLSVLKGGKLVEFMYPATSIALILSDIIDDPLEFIASGPTVLSQENNNKNAAVVLEKYNLLDKVMPSVRKVLSGCCSGNKLELPKTYPLFNIIIGNNSIALTAAKVEIESQQVVPLILSHRTDGLVSVVASIYSKLTECICSFIMSESSDQFLNDLKQFRENYREFSRSVVDIVSSIITNASLIKNTLNQQKAIFLISGGEPTIVVKGNGIGGRNQQLALNLALLLYNLKNMYNFMNNFEVIFMSAGTDGIDGPTDASGAVIYSNLVEDAMAQNLNVELYLKNNDTYSFFSKFKNGKHHIKIGHTGTNVMDLHFLIIKMRDVL